MDIELGHPKEANRPRRRIAACVRCRARKVKCDNKFPLCSACEKAGVECDQTSSSEKILIKRLESRIKSLEALIGTHAPHLSLDDDSALVDFSSHDGADDQQSPLRASGSLMNSRRAEKRPMEPPLSNNLTEKPLDITTAGTPNTPTPSVHSTQIGPEQPLAHEVGLLSLGNTAGDPKYLGPSSGFTLARLTYAAIPQSQGLSSTTRISQADDNTAHSWEQTECIPLPSLAEMRRFIGAYVDTFQSIYPFLEEGKVEQLLEMKLQSPKELLTRASLDDALLFLVAALGARILEQNRQIDLKSSSFLASAMAHVTALQLHDSIQGVQVMLLLVLASFTFPGGLNSWFLSSSIIASCVDLGLQRRKVSLRQDQRSPVADANENVRCGIFWSAYAIDRTICTILGRPLNLRDEAIDVDFPGEIATESSSLNAVSPCQPRGPDSSQSLDRQEGITKKRRIDKSARYDYIASTFFFRFDRITAEIKLMLYRVAQAPSRFPWPKDHVQWQNEAVTTCDELLTSAREALSSQLVVSSHLTRLLPCLEIKYHQCVLLLFRPSPAIHQPSSDACRRCYQSSREVLRIHAEQSRFGELLDSWLTAHLVFVSGITLIYSIMRLPDLAQEIMADPASGFDQSVADCSEVLSHLGKTWSVARDAREKFEKLAALTKDTLKNALRSGTADTGVVPGVRGSSHCRLGNGIEGGTGQVLQSDNPPIGGSDDVQENFNAIFGSSDFLWEELGDMSTWFDLTWMADQPNLSSTATFPL